MPKLLVIEASPRGEDSISRNLAKMFVEQWKTAHPGGEVVERDLVKMDLPYVNLPWLGASLTPTEKHTPEMKDVLRVSDELVAELLAADYIAIGTPVYNYNIPANLKSYVDHIVRKGLTLGLTGEGLIHGKKCTVLMASGGVYTEGSPIRDRDIATMYLRLILKVIGIEDVTFVAAGGTKVVDLGERSRAEFLKTFEPVVTTAAQS
ncbi:FMN-dependent NADH-azoreductase [Chamaesiphon polymorphus]|uniref:FMN dependent NADH:quinone oxidoreductase n=1 Tax=Chamaesiphon polymorphus CCALA 037 TaxID=2107692 RepID=A0A2T1GN47_9CYAN|nr:NAD(P)H-dependent oxidoreductase [Chamaesiphon polymorphus]PSB59357.1 FMN-dependent NADH-azoreductase [Chamaesiphon polymorphus CCALA 037]